MHHASFVLHCADAHGLATAQQAIQAHHYLHAPVDVRCRPLAYCVQYRTTIVGYLIFGRPEATRCYDGGLTYGSLSDVWTCKVAYDRWEVLNLARVWLDPRVQRGGQWYGPDYLPGYVDRRGVWCSTLASWCIQEALKTINRDYLSRYPPAFPNEPYELRAVLSYCDTRLHKGAIYRAAKFELARTNPQGIETWWTPNVALLTPDQDTTIRKLAQHSMRSKHLRARRAETHRQTTLW